MCGFEPQPGRVVLFASKDLTQAELEERVDDPWDQWVADPRRIRVSRREFILSTTMRSLVRIEAADWASAFSGLFARWSPEADPPRRLEAVAEVREVTE
jgi:hypothetical protein